MAYRLPGRYSKDEPNHFDDGGDDDASVDVSVDESYVEHDHSDDDQSEASEVSEEEEEEEEEERPRRRRQIPRRAKSFDESHFEERATRRSSGNGRDSGRRSIRGSVDRKSIRGDERRSLSRDGKGKRMPPRSKTFDGAVGRMPVRQMSMKMKRENSRKSIVDKEAIASNRARRLRAMGEGPHGKVNLLRRSQSFKQSKSNSLLDPSLLSDSEDDDDEKKKDDDGKSGSKKKKLPSRSKSNDFSQKRNSVTQPQIQLDPEEQQYARTAARGVTRSKSLKAERPNLDKASQSVASRLQRMRSSRSNTSTEGDEETKKSSKYRTKKSSSSTSNDDEDDLAPESAAPTASPKAVGLVW